MQKQLAEIKQQLLKTATESKHDFFTKMIPGQHKIYGVKTPVLNEIASQYKPYSFDLAEVLWQEGSLEERIIAIKILEKKGKDDPTRLLKLFRKFASTIDNWAVCDGLGMQFLHSIRKTHSVEIFAIATKFNADKNPWKRRLSLVMIEWYTRNRDYHTIIKTLVNNLTTDEEYYVKKAVNWIKRNFTKEK